ncbi:YraN family protein [Caproiciproducens galactitolivorans]|uniref:YraN family protein n=1 Tax=Caproiciproducens galactitolivorans TaxID=642589 RepID=UPI0024096E8F|nr:YraN family protein [Caproiciproducens galactitolivorans]
MNNASGKTGEDYAARYLEDMGFQITARNYHSRFGEIDIIAENKEFIVFVEVKTRNKNYEVSPLEAVSLGKQKKIGKTAILYLQSNPSDLQPRFDVIGMTTDAGNRILSIEHIENAFMIKEF